MARRGKEMNKDEEEGTEQHHEQPPWGTLEELLLACAVNRHGAKSWDSIAKELQKRASNSSHHAYSPPNCQRRYRHLRRRFSAVDGDDDDNIDTSLVDELKKLRVDELRRDVERRDISIELLELKVKRLEEERQQRKEEGSEKTDRPDELDNREPEETTRRERPASGDDNDNQSFNESNTTSYRTCENRSPEPEVKPGSGEPLPIQEEVGPVEKGSLRLDNTREKKRRRRSEEDEAEGGKLGHAKEIASKSQPLIKILAMLRSHKNGSLFERRLRSQETEKYKKMIRQHMDLQTVQSRMDTGFYLNNKKFFRDLFLLFTNAIIFFPTTSPHHIAALQLRQLLAKHMPTTTPPPPPPKPEPHPNQTAPVGSEPKKRVAKARQPGNNPVLPHKFEPGKKQNVSQQTSTNPVPKKSEPSKNELGSLHPRPNKVGPKLERTEAKPHSNRVSTGSKALEDNKSSKKKKVKERPELSRRSVRVGSGYLERERSVRVGSGYLEREKKKSPPMEDSSSSGEEGGNGGEIEKKKKKKKRGERGRNNGRGNKGRPPSKSPMRRGKRGRREGGEPPALVDSGRPRKRSKR